MSDGFNIEAVIKLKEISNYLKDIGKASIKTEELEKVIESTENTVSALGNTFSKNSKEIGEIANKLNEYKDIFEGLGDIQTTKKLSGTVKDLKSVEKQLEKMGQKVDYLKNTLKTEGNTKDKIKELEKVTKDASKTIFITGRQVKKSKEEIDEAFANDKIQKAAKDFIKDVKDFGNSYDKEMQQINKQTEETKKSIQNFSKDSKENFKKTEEEVKNFSDKSSVSLKDFQSNLRDLARTFVDVFITFKSAGFLKDFTQELTDTEKTLRGTIEGMQGEMEKLKDNVREIRTEVIGDLKDISREFADFKVHLDLKADSDLEKAFADVKKLEDLTGQKIDLKEFGKIVNYFKMGDNIKDIEEYIDTMYRLYAVTRENIDELNQSLFKNKGFWDKLGLSAVEAMALTGAAIKDGNMNIQEFNTAIRTFTSPQVIKKINENFEGGLKEFVTQVYNTKDELEQIALVESVFSRSGGIDNAEHIITLIELVGTQYSETSEQILNGTDTVNQAWKDTLGPFKELQQKLQEFRDFLEPFFAGVREGFEIIIGHICNLIDKLMELLEPVMELNEETLRNIGLITILLTILPLVIALKTVLGKIFNIFSTTILPFFVEKIQGVILFFKKMGGIIKYLAEVIMPFFGKAITVLINIIRKLEGVCTIANIKIIGIAIAVIVAVTTIINYIKTIVNFIKTAGWAIAEFFTGLWSTLLMGFSAFTAGLIGIYNKTIGKLRGKEIDYKDTFSYQVLQDSMSLFEKALEQRKKRLDKWEDTKKQAKEDTQKAKDNIQKLKNYITDFKSKFTIEMPKKLKLPKFPKIGNSLDLKKEFDNIDIPEDINKNVKIPEFDAKNFEKLGKITDTLGDIEKDRKKKKEKPKKKKDKKKKEKDKEQEKRQKELKKAIDDLKKSIENAYKSLIKSIDTFNYFVEKRKSSSFVLRNSYRMVEQTKKFVEMQSSVLKDLKSSQAKEIVAKMTLGDMGDLRALYDLQRKGQLQEWDKNYLEMEKILKRQAVEVTINMKEVEIREEADIEKLADALVKKFKSEGLIPA